MKKFLKILWRTFLVLLTVIVLLLVAAFGAVSVISLGPSETAKSMFVNTVMSTSAAKFLAKIYFTDEEIAAYIEPEEEMTEVAYSPDSLDMIQISTPDENVSENSASDNGAEEPVDVKITQEMDPSAINTDEDGDGIEVLKIVEETGAVAAINGGGFYDPDGHGHGGMPLGPVIQDGTLISNYQSDWYTLIGMTADHKLMTGNMTASDAIANGMYEGITFGPVLVQGGEVVDFGQTKGGLNPRSAIGQRADGAVLLLTINGRQPGSLGATYKDTAELLVKYGAVTAANLDGGSSSRLFYNGEQLNKSSSILGMRPVPNAIIVQ